MKVASAVFFRLGDMQIDRSADVQIDRCAYMRKMDFIAEPSFRYHGQNILYAISNSIIFAKNFEPL